MSYTPKTTQLDNVNWWHLGPYGFTLTEKQASQWKVQSLLKKSTITFSDPFLFTELRLLYILKNEIKTISTRKNQHGRHAEFAIYFKDSRDFIINMRRIIMQIIPSKDEKLLRTFRKRFRNDHLWKLKNTIIRDKNKKRQLYENYQTLETPEILFLFWKIIYKLTI